MSEADYEEVALRVLPKRGPSTGDIRAVVRELVAAEIEMACGPYDRWDGAIMEARLSAARQVWQKLLAELDERGLRPFYEIVDAGEVG